MIEVSSTEADRDFGHYRDMAKLEPVTVMHENQPSVVIIAAAEYERLKRRDMTGLSVTTVPQWLANLTATTETAPKA